MKLILCLFMALLVSAPLPGASDVLPVPTQTGEYTSGPWTYSYKIEAKATRSEGRRGRLTYKGIELRAPLGTILVTPFGRLLQLLPPEIKGWGAGGWVNTLTYDRPVFKADGTLTDELARQLGDKVQELDLDRVLELSRGK